jgi:hypothetical protein
MMVISKTIWSLDPRVPILWLSAKFGSKKQKMRKIGFLKTA